MNVADKKPCVTKDVLDLCDEMRDLKKMWYEEEGVKNTQKANKMSHKAPKKTKEDWIDTQCKEIDACLNKNNNKKAYQLVKELASEKQGRSTTIHDKPAKCFTEEQEIRSRQSIAQSYTTMRIMVTIQFCTQKKIYSQSLVRKLRSQ